MKLLKFTTAKIRMPRECFANRQVKQKNYAIILRIALAFTLITT